MSGINKLLIWLEENKDLKLSTEFIKLQAKVFSLEEKYSLEHFQAVQQQIFNPKKEKNEQNSKINR
jgi:hypothetical protein